MSTEHRRLVTVRLNSADDLFADPESGGGSDRFESGIEELYRAIRVHTRVFTRPDQYQVTLELPREQITDGADDTIRAKASLGVFGCAHAYHLTLCGH
jgi:hypothetical protein